MHKHLSWRLQQQDHLQSIHLQLHYLNYNFLHQFDNYEKLILADELVCNTCDACEGNNERDYGDGDICELVDSHSVKSKGLRLYPDRTSHNLLMIQFQQHIPLYRFPCSKFVELYISFVDRIHLPLLPLETEALQLELMVEFSLLTHTSTKNIGFF